MEFDQLLSTLMGHPGAASELVWSIDDNLLRSHLMRTRDESMRLRSQSVDSIAARRGPTAVIRVHGVMMKDAYWSDEVSTPIVARAVQLAAADEEVESILMDFDTPGGSTAGMPELADAIAAAGKIKPIVAQCTGMMASAGYYAASQCDKIYSQRMDWVGSIGTRMSVWDVSKLMENIGVKRMEFTTGPLKATGAFGTPITEAQQNYLQGLTDDFQKEFASVVMQGRGFSAEQFAAVSTGAVFPAAEAMKLGLIDGLQTIDKTLASMPRRQTSTRSKAMSEPNAAEPVVTSTQLKKEFPKSSADWREAQVEAGATMQDATKAWAGELEAQLATERAAREEAEKKAAAKPETKPEVKPRGNPPIGKPEAQGEGIEDPYAFVQEEVGKKVAAGMSRDKAVKSVYRAHPGLREAIVAQANEHRQAG